MDTELKYIVYITINLCNGKFYIGYHETNPNVFDGYIGCGIYRQSNANKDFPLHKAVRKYGYENFKRTTLVIFPHTEEGKKQASALETVLVNEAMIKSKSTYNIAVGGLGGSNIDTYKRVYMFDLNGNYLRSFQSSREAAFYIDPKNIDNTRQAIKNNCQGLTNSSNGYFWSYKKEFIGFENKKLSPVSQYTLSGKFLRHFKSISEAEHLLELNAIYQAINKKGQCGGYQWRYYDGSTNDIAPLMNNKSKFDTIAINMFDKEGNLIKSYESINQCVKEHSEFDKSQIMRVLKKIIKTHKGYSFKFKDEDIVSFNQK